MHPLLVEVLLSGIIFSNVLRQSQGELPRCIDALIALRETDMNVLREPHDFAVVKSTPMFAGLSADAFDALIAGAHVKSITRGELLFVQDDPVRSCFVVLDGWVKVYRLTPSGGEAIVAIFTRGQSFAEAAAFTGGRFPASGEAITDGRLLQIQTAHLLRLIRENPDIGLAMLSSTSFHLHMLVQQIEQLKAQTGAQRVAEFLLSLCRTKAGACEIHLPYDKVLIAGRVGMKPESLSRAFVRLRPLGVHIEQSTAIIEDVERLRHYAESEMDKEQ